MNFQGHARAESVFGPFKLSLSSSFLPQSMHITRLICERSKHISPIASLGTPLLHPQGVLRVDLGLMQTSVDPRSAPGQHVKIVQSVHRGHSETLYVHNFVKDGRALSSLQTFLNLRRSARGY